MKKLLICLLTITMLICSVLAFGCKNESKWEYPSFSDFGKVTYQNGFICTTENYILFINGVGDNTDDNNYGNAVKGSLMAIKISDFKDGNYDKAEIIVPKLFVAKDYTSGIFVSNGYVYYGTPSLDKNSSGQTATSEMVFMKSAISSNEKPVKLFSLSSLDYSYRILENENGVYIVYYDTEDTALKVYSEKDNTTSIIAQTDDKTTTKSGDYYLSLDSYKFVNDKEFAVVYTAKVYNENYYEDKAEKDNYSRSTASFNYVYTYKVGDTAKENETFLGSKVMCEANTTYALTYAKGNEVFYTATVGSNDAVNYCNTIANLGNGKTEIANSDKLADTTLFDGDYIYYIDSDNGYIVKSSLDKTTSQQDTLRVCKTSNASSLAFILDGSVYFYNSENYLYRLELNNIDAEEVKITDVTVNTSWYGEEIISIEDKNYLFFANSTTLGSNYIYVVELSGEVLSETDDDDVTTYFLKDSTFIGERKVEDDINVFTDALSKIGSTIEFATKDGTLYSEEIENARKIYDDLSKDLKKKVSDTDLDKLQEAEKAVKLANAYYLLKDVVNYDDLDDNKKAELKNNYNSAKTIRSGLEKSKNIAKEKDFTTIRDMLEENLKYYYQECVELFETEE